MTAAAPANDSLERCDPTGRKGGRPADEEPQGGETNQDAFEAAEHVPLDDNDDVVNGSDGGPSPRANDEMPRSSNRVVDEVGSQSRLLADDEL